MIVLKRILLVPISSRSIWNHQLIICFVLRTINFEITTLESLPSDKANSSRSLKKMVTIRFLKKKLF